MFQIISDCYLELVKDKWTNLPRITPRAPWLVLAGDIGNPYKKNDSMFLERCSQSWERVFVVSGNHEYYSHSAKRLMHHIDNKLREVCSRFSNITFLQKDTVRIPDPETPDKQILIAGCTMWTRMGQDNQPLIQAQMNDYRCIFGTRIGTKSYNVTTSDIDTIHKDHASWLYDAVKEGEQDPTVSHVVVITHHPGSFCMLDTRFGGKSNPINHAYATDYDRLIQSWSKVRIWFSGHTHIVKQDIIGKTRLISNCLGYPNRQGGNDGYYNDLWVVPIWEFIPEKPDFEAFKTLNNE